VDKVVLNEQDAAVLVGIHCGQWCAGYAQRQGVREPMTPGANPGWADDELPAGPPDPADAGFWWSPPPEPPEPRAAAIPPSDPEPHPGPEASNASQPAYDSQPVRDSEPVRSPEVAAEPEPADLPPWATVTRPVALLGRPAVLESWAGLPLARHRRRRRLVLFVLIAGLASVSLAAVLVMAAGAARSNKTANPFGNLPPLDASTSQEPAQSPAPTPSAHKPPSPTATHSTAAKPTTMSPSRARPIAPVTYEAEAPGNLIGGSAWVQRFSGASGGAIIRNLGDWSTSDGPGTLTVTGIRVPAAGAYTLTVFYLHLDNEKRRTLVFAVAGQPATSVTVTGSATCCASRAIRISLRAGVNAITFGNPNGHAPSIDKIVISAATS
jgi:hypothetical protein